ncbi:BTB/POZ and MATH domain-containing protein 1-like [Panicum hallii]|nr:BTB/POZ and MATH domain-containing protein 1-like [Panicum hallii]
MDGANEDSIGLYIQLVTRGARATAAFHFSLLDPTASLPPLPLCVLDDAPGTGYLTRDGMLVECTVTVVVPPPESAAAAGESGRAAQLAAQPTAAVPPSDMMDQLRDMYASGHGTDVTFSVGGELLRAHRIIVAMRSPVFRAELYEEMAESRAHRVEVHGVRPDAFKALLRYIYTDDDTFTTSPAAAAAASGGEDGDGGGEATTTAIQDVLVAVDRYGVERLKLICEHRLREALGVGNVARMLAFAEDHHCAVLREACIRFIATCDRMGDLVATLGDAQLVSTRPLILIEVLEKSHKFRSV